MNDYIRRNLECGQRCRQWFIDFKALITGGIFKAKSIAMTAKVDELETTAGEQEAAESEGYSATDVKGSERSDLEDEMDPVRTAARAAEFDIPGTRDRYRFNRGMSHQQLLAAGRSFAIGGATDDAIIAAYGAPVDWIAQCDANADAFEAVTQLQSQATGEKVGKRALTLALVDDLMQLIRTAGFIIENVFEGDVAALASWKSASHVKTKKYTPPPPPTP